MKAVLCGFQYLSTEKINTIPGICIDLYTTMISFKKLSIEVIIISDIEKITVDELLPSLIEGYTSSDIYKWLNETLEYHLVTTKEALVSILDRENPSIFYFTGHGINNQLLLPSNELLNPLDIAKSNMFMILDCCDMKQFNLPYKFMNGKHGCLELLNTEKIYVELYILVPNHINPTTTFYGSPFTRDLNQAFVETKLAWNHLPLLVAWSSCIPSRTLPTWLISSNKINVYPSWVEIII